MGGKRVFSAGSGRASGSHGQLKPKVKLFRRGSAPLRRLLSKLPGSWKSTTRLVLVESKKLKRHWARLQRCLKACSGKTLAEVLMEQTGHVCITRRQLFNCIMRGYLRGVGIKMQKQSQFVSQDDYRPILPEGWTNETRLVLSGTRPRSQKVRDRVQAWAGRTVGEVFQEPGAPGLHYPGAALIRLIEGGYFAQKKTSASNVPTRAITISGAQRCWLVLRRKKVIENRSVRLKPGCYALHCSKIPCSLKLTRKQRISCGKTLPPDELELAPRFCGHVVGVVQIGAAKSYAECAMLPWAERRAGPSGKSWCMKITKAVDLSSVGPFPVAGGQQVWRLAPETRRELARRLGKRAN